MKRFFFYSILTVVLFTAENKAQENRLNKMYAALESTKTNYGILPDGTKYFISDKDIKNFVPALNREALTKKENKNGTWIWTN
jgi:hypothetical protein